MNLQDKILYLRKKAGLSQEALAERLGVSRQAISKWETGDATPELSKLVALAKEFGVTTDWLLSENEVYEEPEKKRTEAGFFERILKKYGWLAGLYIAAYGAAFALFGYFLRYRILGNFPMAEEIPALKIYLGIMIFGIVVIIIGTALAVILKRKGRNSIDKIDK